MVYINEWLPNPDGNDAKGEFIELFNRGTSTVNLSGWTLKTTGKKIFSLDGREITSDSYLVLLRTNTKISLKNTGETVLLYNASGQLVDRSSYLGSAPSGQSFSRVAYPIATSGGVPSSLNLLAEPQGFAWAPPTPGAENKISLHATISAIAYPFNQPVNARPPNVLEVVGSAAIVGIVLAVAVMYCLKHAENFSKLIFPRDRKNRL
jgi:hypothetical protein